MWLRLSCRIPGFFFYVFVFVWGIGEIMRIAHILCFEVGLWDLTGVAVCHAKNLQRLSAVVHTLCQKAVSRLDSQNSLELSSLV